MTDRRTYGHVAVPLAAALATLLAASLAGCTSQVGSADDKLGSFLVAPDKYVLYTCAELGEEGKRKRARELELEALMAKAGTGVGGTIVSAVGYKPEYLEVHGEMNELRAAAVQKKCNFVPGESPLPAPASAAAGR
jgi:hypothetical protein